MSESFAEMAKWEFTERHILALRELLSYDALCPRSNHLVPIPAGGGILQWWLPPSPLHWSRQVEWPWAILNSDLSSTDICLDIGGGWAVVQYAIAARCKTLVELEPNPDPLQHVRWMQQVYGFGSNIEQVQGSVLEIPFPDNHFDRVFNLSVLEHLPEGTAFKALEECLRVLRPGGRLLLTMDVRVEGHHEGGDFNLDGAQARQILQRLNIKEIRNSITIGTSLGGVTLSVLLICYDKP